MAQKRSAVISVEDSAIWDRLVAGHAASVRAMQQFLAATTDRVGLIRRSLHDGTRLRAIYMLDWLTASDLTELFDELLFQSMAMSGIDAVHRAFLRMPRGWALQNLEQAAERMMENGDLEGFGGLLGICYVLDRDLTIRVGRRAMQHSNEAFRKVGAFNVEWVEREDEMTRRRKGCT